MLHFYLSFFLSTLFLSYSQSLRHRLIYVLSFNNNSRLPFLRLFCLPQVVTLATPFSHNSAQACKEKFQPPQSLHVKLTCLTFCIEECVIILKMEQNSS